MHKGRLAGARIMGVLRQAAAGLPLDVWSSPSTGPEHQGKALSGAAAMAHIRGLRNDQPFVAF